MNRAELWWWVAQNVFWVPHLQPAIRVPAAVTRFNVSAVHPFNPLRGSVAVEPLYLHFAVLKGLVVGVERKLFLEGESLSIFLDEEKQACEAVTQGRGDDDP